MTSSRPIFTTNPAPMTVGFAARMVAAVFLLTATSCPTPRAETEECTIAVITGAVTTDGRPLFWKNRDTGDKFNEVVYFDDGAYPYITLTTIADSLNARFGVNEAGFAVINALSHNLPDTLTEGITNGVLMKRALQTCASAADFESLLVETSVPGRKYPSNMGVLDASGGAVIFEVYNHRYVRFDANDPMTAPDGFLVRTNFSFSADTTGVETWRYNRAYEMIAQAAIEEQLDVSAVLETARDLTTPWVDPYPLPYPAGPPMDPNAIGFVDAGNTINRSATAAFGVVRGVHPGEDPRLTTFYAAPGHPVVTIVLPVWVAAGPTPEALHTPLGSPLCLISYERTLSCYIAHMHPEWLNTFFLVHGDGADGYLVRVNAIEEWLLAETEGYLQAWYQSAFDDSVVAGVEHELAALAFDQYEVPVSPPAGIEGGEAFAALAPLTCWPNPMREEAVFRIPAALGLARSAGIEIWDATGRLVRRLIPEEEDASRRNGLVHEEGAVVHWDGRDRAGRPVAAGVYFFRPSGTGPGARGSVVVLR